MLIHDKHDTRVHWSPEPKKPRLRMEVVGVTLMLCCVALAIFLVYVMVLYLPHWKFIPH